MMQNLNVVETKRNKKKYNSISKRTIQQREKKHPRLIAFKNCVIRKRVCKISKMLIISERTKKYKE